MFSVIDFFYEQILNMAEENINQEFRFKNVEEIKNLFIKEIVQNKLMGKKQKKMSSILNYVGHFLILASAITGSVSISTFASLFGVPIEITSSVQD